MGQKVHMGAAPLPSNYPSKWQTMPECAKSTFRRLLLMHSLYDNTVTLSRRKTHLRKKHTRATLKGDRKVSKCDTYNKSKSVEELEPPYEESFDNVFAV